MMSCGSARVLADLIAGVRHRSIWPTCSRYRCEAMDMTSNFFRLHHSALFFMSIRALLLTSRGKVGTCAAPGHGYGAIVIAAFGIALNTSQESLPPFLSFVPATLLIVVGAAVSALGTRDYRLHRPLPCMTIGWPGGGASASIIAFHAPTSHPEQRHPRRWWSPVPTALIGSGTFGLLLAVALLCG